MGCASKNLSPSKTEECDMHPLNHDASNETHQGPPDGAQGYLAACYGIFVYTKPSWSHFGAEFGIRLEFESKINRKRRMDRAENLTA